MSSVLRVVDITQCYSPTSGGIRTYLHAKADWAARRGVAHGVVATGPCDAETQLGQSPMILVRGRTPTDRWGYRLAVRPLGVLRALDALAPNVVVVHDALSFPRSVAEWTRRRGVPLVLLCHSHLRAAASGLPGPLRRPLGAGLAFVQRRAFAVGEVVLVASRVIREHLAAEVAAPLCVSPLGVDVTLAAAARADRDLRGRLAPGDVPLLLYAGRLSSEKHLELLPEVVRRLPGAPVLAVAGAGAAQARIDRLARRLGVEGRIRFLGHVADRRALMDLMATADCFVHPNPDEPFGLAPLEAIAVGCRVVAPSTVGTADVLERFGAVLVAPDDPAALAQGVTRALRRPRPAPDLAQLGWDRTFEAEWRLYAGLRP